MGASCATTGARAAYLQGKALAKSAAALSVMPFFSYAAVPETTKSGAGGPPLLLLPSQAGIIRAAISRNRMRREVAFIS